MLRRDIEAPTLEKSITERDAQPVKPKTDKDDPTLTTLLRDTDAPKCTTPKTERLEPTLPKPNKEMAEPTLTNLRRDIALPRCAEFQTARADPRRA
jgi:hypothetical protein